MMQVQSSKLLRCSRGLGNAKTVDLDFNGVRFFSPNLTTCLSLILDRSFQSLPCLYPDNQLQVKPRFRSRLPISTPARVACPVQQHPSPQPERCAHNTTINNNNRVSRSPETRRPPS